MLITHLCLVATILNGDDIKITIITEISPVAQTLKRLPAMRETWVRSLGWEYPLEKGTATHPNILAWRNQRVRYDQATFTFMEISDIRHYFSISYFY